MIDISVSALIHWTTIGGYSLSAILLVIGLYILNRDFEIGSLYGIFPVLAGLAIAIMISLTWLVYFIAHVHFIP